MLKYSFLCSSIIFIVMNIITPPQIYPRAIKEEVIEKYSKRIEKSDNFKYYNVLFNQQGEKIGLEETTEPMYGQEIVIIYKANGFNDSEMAQFIIFDYSMENAIYKKIPIINGELRFEGKLFTDKQNMEKLFNESHVQFFCMVILPDFSIKKSKLMNVNITLNLSLEIYEHQLDDSCDYEFVLESNDGEYRQERNILKEGILYNVRQGLKTYRITRLMFTDIMLHKTYKLSAPLVDIVYYENMNILDELEYYDEE